VTQIGAGVVKQLNPDHGIKKFEPGYELEESKILELLLERKFNGYLTG
jgi:hypothetical protein